MISIENSFSVLKRSNAKVSIICKQEFQKKKNKEIIEKLEESAPD